MARRIAAASSTPSPPRALRGASWLQGHLPPPEVQRPREARVPMSQEAESLTRLPRRVDGRAQGLVDGRKGGQTDRQAGRQAGRQTDRAHITAHEHSPAHHPQPVVAARAAPLQLLLPSHAAPHQSTFRAVPTAPTVWYTRRGCLWGLYPLLYVLRTRQRIRRPAPGPSQCDSWVGKSSQVMCIYTGTHQLFPTLVLTEDHSPSTVVRDRYGLLSPSRLTLRHLFVTTVFLSFGVDT